ncbi:MAG: TlpA family protein disulfide reductase [Bacteroidia bacterium]|nr:TlpA family protein disulfide reductase [Bacteroidia bacterium]
MNNKWIGAVLLVLAALLGFYFYNKYRVAPAITFPKLELKDLQGNAVLFESFKSKKLVVCFSATWCGNCWEELETISAIKNTELNDVEVLVISDEPVEKIEKFVKRLNPTFTCLQLQTPFSKIGIHSLPTSYILNKNLEVKKDSVGYLDWSDPATLQHLKTLMQ